VKPGEFIPYLIHGKPAFLYTACPNCGMKNTVALWDQTVKMDDSTLFSLDPGVDCLDSSCGIRIQVIQGLFPSHEK
jgi:hypothetical protein